MVSYTNGNAINCAIIVMKVQMLLCVETDTDVVNKQIVVVDRIMQCIERIPDLEMKNPI